MLILIISYNFSFILHLEGKAFNPFYRIYPTNDISLCNRFLFILLSHRLFGLQHLFLSGCSTCYQERIEQGLYRCCIRYE